MVTALSARPFASDARSSFGWAAKIPRSQHAARRWNSGLFRPDDRCADFGQRRADPLAVVGGVHDDADSGVHRWLGGGFDQKGGAARSTAGEFFLRGVGVVAAARAH